MLIGELELRALGRCGDRGRRGRRGWNSAKYDAISRSRSSGQTSNLDLDRPAVGARQAAQRDLVRRQRAFVDELGVARLGLGDITAAVKQLEQPDRDRDRHRKPAGLADQRPTTATPDVASSNATAASVRTWR